MSASSYNLFGFEFGDNPEQRELIRLIRLDPKILPVVYCLGEAGTGKTFASLAGALSLIRGKGSEKRYKTIYYVREPVEVGHRLGYLKGTEQDKYAPYLGPLLDNYSRLMEKTRAEKGASLKETRSKKEISPFLEVLPYAYQHLPSDIIPLAPEFLRGRSFSDCIILVDEAQNMDFDELHTLLTRIGQRCKMILLGSPNQIDVPDQSKEDNDFLRSYGALKSTGLVGMVELRKSMRSDFVAEFDRLLTQAKPSRRNK